MEPPAPVTKIVLPDRKPDRTSAVELHRVAAEQVIELNLAQLGHGDFAGDDVVEGGNGQHLQTGPRGESDGLAPNRVRHRRHGDDRMLDLEVGRHARDIGELPAHGGRRESGAPAW